MLHTYHSLFFVPFIPFNITICWISISTRVYKSRRFGLAKHRKPQLFAAILYRCSRKNVLIQSQVLTAIASSQNFEVCDDSYRKSLLRQKSVSFTDFSVTVGRHNICAFHKLDIYSFYSPTEAILIFFIKTLQFSFEE